MQGAAPTAVLVMAGASDASPPAVGRARREALTSVKRTVEADAACGGNQVQTWDLVALLVTALQKAKSACATSTMPW